MRKKLRAARRFACYYGPDQVAMLAQQEVAILAPQQQTAPNLQRLATSTITLAYLSLGEDSSEFGSSAEPVWAMREPGSNEIIRNPIWGGIVVNLEHPEWTKTIFERASAALAQGFQGFFLDTLDRSSAKERRQLTRLIRELRQRWPNAPIVINRGFGLLSNVQQWIDGLVFESFCASWKFDAHNQIVYHALSAVQLGQHHQLAKDFQEIARAWELAFWAIDYTDGSPELEAFVREQTERAGLISFTSDRSLRRLPSLQAKLSRDPSSA